MPTIEQITEILNRKITALYPGEKVIETYKGFDITLLGPEDPHTPYFTRSCIQVLDHAENTRFIVGLDDSKRSGRRVSYPASIDDARYYIDQLLNHRETIKNRIS